jgi:NAD-dependent SIR2 family protein deacetylase
MQAFSEKVLKEAAKALAAADALLIGAGAGMGVDSGLPDFRGDHGFWRAYPPFEKMGLNFIDLANPRWFSSDPTLAWGFYGHRLNLYRVTEPHAGFAIFRRWSERMNHGAFVFTSNVDGHFQRAGFHPHQIVEIHGSIEWMQCTRKCGEPLFAAAADGNDITVDETTMRAGEPLPVCPGCGALARPNVLMFGDPSWNGARTGDQWNRLDRWLQSLARGRLVIVECGAGLAIPSVRNFCEELAVSRDAALIRINPREAEVPRGHISLAAGALEGLQAIDEQMTSTRHGMS